MKRIYSTPEEHLKHYPEARTSTLAWIAKRNAVNEALRNKPRLKPQRKLNAFLKTIWEFLK